MIKAVGGSERLPTKGLVLIVAMAGRSSMRILDIGKIGRELTVLLEEDDPVEEDIGIVGKDGDLIGVIIRKDAYDFFIRKVEEEEDRQDLRTVEEFHASREKNQ